MSINKITSKKKWNIYSIQQLLLKLTSLSEINLLHTLFYYPLNKSENILF